MIQGTRLRYWDGTFLHSTSGFSTSFMSKTAPIDSRTVPERNKLVNAITSGVAPREKYVLFEVEDMVIID